MRKNSAVAESAKSHCNERSKSKSESAANAVSCVDRTECGQSPFHVPVTGPPKYAAAAIKSTLHPNLLSQAFALSSPLPLPLA